MAPKRRSQTRDNSMPPPAVEAPLTRSKKRRLSETNGESQNADLSTSAGPQPAGDEVERDEAYQNLLSSIFNGLAAPANAEPQASASSSSDAEAAVEDDSDGDGDSQGGASADRDAEGAAATSAQGAPSSSAKEEVAALSKWNLELDVPEAASLDTGLHDITAGRSKAGRAPLYDRRKAAKAAAKARDDTTGSGWFDMKAPVVTDEVKRDWRLLRLRAAYDTKTFYKKPDSTAIPKHFAMGTLIEGRGEYYSGRLTQKQRKQTMTEELLADIEFKKARKKRYERIQEAKQELANKRKKMKALHKRSKHKPKH